MTYLTRLIGRLGKSLGIGTASTAAPAASDSAHASDAVQEPANPSSAAEAPTVSTIAGD
jgi:hypothetical protein